MNQMRVSDDSAKSVQVMPPRSICDDQSSILSILSRVRQGKPNQPVMNTENRESIASFLRQNPGT